ncbi:MAG: hypothetical protein ABJG47_02740 [Ekhidna sp.]
MILIPVFFGCQTGDDLGIQYDLGSDANVNFQEFTLPATSIYIDSLRTDSETTVLVGNYSNTVTGAISAEGYFNIFYEEGPLARKRATSSEPNPEDTLKLDSIVVMFESNAIIPQSGSVFQEFSLYELQDSLENSAIYLSRLKQTTATQIGSYSQIIDPLKDTLHSFKLNGVYAQTFFDQISDIAGDSTKSIATTTFKSLGLIPGGSSESILSLSLTSDTTRMIVYSSPIDNNDTTYLTFFQFNGKKYTYLDRDRSGSSFDGIVEFEDFDLPDGKTVMDPLAGINTAISITSLEDFFDQNRNILINNATLEFEFESEVDRDTLANFMSFFRKSDGSIFGPAIASNPFGNIVMTDNGYLNNQSAPAISILSDDKSKLLSSSTLFYQIFYSEYLENDSLVFQNPSGENLIPIDDLVTIATSGLNLQRSIFKQDGIKLRIYYTEVER